MPLKVVSFVTYLTNSDQKWRQDDWGTMKFVKAVKGDGVNGSAWVRVGDQDRRLTQENAEDAIGWFGELGAEYIKAKRLKRPLVLVPVPNSKCTIGNKRNSRTLHLAKAIASRLSNVKVWAGLRWKNSELSARKGGARQPAVLYKRLAVTKSVPGARVVLIDDVYTTGGHLRASAAKIVKRGGRCILALCLARTVANQDQEPFSILEERLETFRPHK